MDFFWNFSEFFRDFLDFENIYKNDTPIFKVKIYKNTLQFSKSEIYRNAILIFKVKNYRNVPPNVQIVVEFLELSIDEIFPRYCIVHQKIYSRTHRHDQSERS